MIYHGATGDAAMTVENDGLRAGAGDGPAMLARRGTAPTRVVVLGGGFAGVYAARTLERLTRRRRDVDIVLVSRDNFFLMTPLLFEACSGALELRHCSAPIREFFRRTRFIEATVRQVDLERRLVLAAAAEGEGHEIPFDHLVLALGAVTNESLIPGSEFAFTFKTLADAIVVRNHVIERFERADGSTDGSARRRLLTFVVIGGGLVGVEVFGELTAFAEDIRRNYPRVRREDLRFVLRQAEPQILPEADARLAEYAVRVLRRRPGVDIRSGAPVRRIERGVVHLADESIAADTIILAAGILPSPVVAGLPVAKDHHGRVLVDGAMRSPSHAGVWGLGDCASVPGPDGRPYPYLAQHAMRQAKRLARNLEH